MRRHTGAIRVIHAAVLAAMTLIVVIACDDRARSTSADVAPAPTQPTAAPATEIPATGVAPGVISENGIGPAQRGMTIGQLRAALPAGDVLGTREAFMVDIDAMAVTRGSDTMFVVLIPAGESSADSAPIEVVATQNRSMRTAAGIGPGSGIADAARAYGSAKLTYNMNDESREYVLFANLPSSIHVRAAPSHSDSAFAGIYTTQTEYNETSRYNADAIISMIMVFLR